MLEPVETKYLRFEFKEAKPKTEVWLVKNKHHGNLLGEIRYYPQWRQYCFIINLDVIRAAFENNEELIFSQGCHKDIDNFIAKLQQVLHSKK